METKDRTQTPGRPTGTRATSGRGQRARKRPARPSVVYTDPKPFDGKRLALRLVTAVAVSLAVLFGVSIFFKVDMDKVTVAGADQYSVNQVIEASGIQNGNNLLTLSNARISGRIMAKLPYVDEVRVGIKLPDTVHIEIKEVDVVYAVEATDGNWWLINADGKVVDTVDASQSKTYTGILGIKLDAPAVGQMAVAAEENAESQPDDSQPPETTAAASEPDETAESTQAPETTKAPEGVSVTGKERLEIAVEILQNLEKCGIVGDAASVDVTNPMQLQMWYGKRYQVNLGDRQRLDYKISLMKGAIDQMGEHQGGNLDVSFMNWPDEVAYTPFSE